MSKFKVGDRVIGNSKARMYSITKPGYIGIVGDCYGGGEISIGIYIVNEEAFDLLEEVNSNKNNMNIKEKFIGLFLSEPEKSFRKAGITNGDGMLTTDGQSVFLSYLLKKYGDDFKTNVVDELLKEENK